MMTVIASCYKDESSRAILEREFGRTELLVDYLDVAETESTNAAPDSLGEFGFPCSPCENVPCRWDYR